MYCKVIPGYVKSFKRQYICLLGIDQEFSHINKELYFEDVKKRKFKKKRKIYRQIIQLYKKIWGSRKIWIF